METKLGHEAAWNTPVVSTVSTSVGIQQVKNTKKTGFCCTLDSGGTQHYWGKTDKNGKDLKEIDQDMICKILKLFFFIFDDIVHLTKQFGLCILAVYWWPAVKTCIYNYSWIKHCKNWKNITTYFQLKSYSFPLSQYLVMLH